MAKPSITSTAITMTAMKTAGGPWTVDKVVYFITFDEEPQCTNTV